jgi:hypothetical protein
MQEKRCKQAVHGESSAAQSSTRRRDRDWLERDEEVPADEGDVVEVALGQPTLEDVQQHLIAQLGQRRLQAVEPSRSTWIR